MTQIDGDKSIEFFGKMSMVDDLLDKMDKVIQNEQKINTVYRKIPKKSRNKKKVNTSIRSIRSIRSISSDDILNFFSSQGDELRIMSYLYVNTNLTRKELETQFPDIESNTLYKQLDRSDYIVSKKTKGINHYNLTKSGNKHIELLYQQHLLDQEKIVQLQEQDEKRKNYNLDLVNAAQNYVEKNLDLFLTESPLKEISVKDILSKDVFLVDAILETPGQAIKAFEIACDEIDTLKGKPCQIAFKNVPESAHISIAKIRSRHLNKLYQVSGRIRRKTSVRPKTTSIQYECLECGNPTTILQLSDTINKPKHCKCGSDIFREISKELHDAQVVTIEQSFNTDTRSHQLNVFLSDALCSHEIDQRMPPGTEIRVTGIIKEVRIGKKTVMDIAIEGLHIEPMETSLSDVIVTEEDIKQFKIMVKQPSFMDDLKNSIHPHIEGMSMEKEALIVSIGGGVAYETTKKATHRGDIHLLLLGDPGTAKSQLIKRISAIVPKTMYTSGKGSSGVGLTASVVKDELMGGYALEAGTIPLCNHGLCVIDELDKMSKNDRKNLHEAMEEQTITIAKANIQATLQAKTTLIAAANPKEGRFQYDQYSTIFEQINLPPALFQRFDMIILLHDIIDQDKDTAILNKMLSVADPIEQPFDDTMLTKYFAHVRTYQPHLNNDAKEAILNYVVDLRQTTKNTENKIPLGIRAGNHLHRITQAYAKLDLCDTAQDKHARKAINLYNYMMGLLYKTDDGFDFSILHGHTSKMKNLKYQIKSKAEELMHEHKEKTFSMDQLIPDLLTMGHPKSALVSAIATMTQQGDLYESPKGRWHLKC